MSMHAYWAKYFRRLSDEKAVGISRDINGNRIELEGEQDPKAAAYYSMRAIQSAALCRK